MELRREYSDNAERYNETFLFYMSDYYMFSVYFECFYMHLQVPLGVSLGAPLGISMCHYARRKVYH